MTVPRNQTKLIDIIMNLKLFFLNKLTDMCNSIMVLLFIMAESSLQLPGAQYVLVGVRSLISDKFYPSGSTTSEISISKSVLSFKPHNKIRPDGTRPGSADSDLAIVDFWETILCSPILKLQSIKCFQWWTDDRRYTDCDSWE